jgi:hypothetical protein
VEALPGVEAASFARPVPVARGGTRTTLRVEGYTPAEGEDMELTPTAPESSILRPPNLADTTAQGRNGLRRNRSATMLD